MAVMTAQPHRLDERHHVEKPLPDQLAGLGWEILDLDSRQRPADTFRESFAEVLSASTTGAGRRSACPIPRYAAPPG